MNAWVHVLMSINCICVCKRLLINLLFTLEVNLYLEVHSVILEKEILTDLNNLNEQTLNVFMSA